MLKANDKKGLGKQIVSSVVLGVAFLAGAARLPAQTTVEARLAALEARIQELESELAAARGMTPQPVAVPVSAPGSKLQGAFLRPAVLTSPATMAMASAAAAAPAAAMAPPLQAGSTPDFTGDFEGLNFFKGVKFGGFAETYYTFNFNKPSPAVVDYRNFDFNHNSLTLSQVDFEMTKAVSESSPLGYMLQLAFGPTADAVNFGDPGIGNSTGRHFMQYYLSGRIPAGSRGITLDVGKYVTQHGAEVIDSRADWNLSRGLLFAWAIPYYHFGVRATIPVADTLSLGASISNGWNNVVDNNGGKTGGFMVSWNPTSRFSFIQNYMIGHELSGDTEDTRTRHLFDSLMTIKLHDKVTFMVNYDYGMDRAFASDDPSTPAVEVDTVGAHAHWQGVAAYLRLAPTDWFAFTPRYEFFDDRQGFMTGSPQQLKSFTLTPEFVIKQNLVTRFEWRRDWSTKGNFSLGPESDPDDAFSQETVGVGLILKF